MIQFKNENAIVFESSLFRTTSTVILTDDLVLVADPNWLPGEVEDIRRFVESMKFGRPVYLLFTHSDYDHIIGYRAFEGAKVIASESFAESNSKTSIIEQILQWDDENYVRRSYPIEYPEVDFIVKNDGQTLRVGDTVLTFYLAPGHNEDGVFTIVEAPQYTGFAGKNRSIWIAGDYLSNVEFPYIYFNSHAYERTLDKVDEILGKHYIGLLVPGHGDVALHENEIRQRQQDSFEYIQTLRNCQKEGLSFSLEKLWEKYQYRRGMESFHEGNIQIIRNELRYWINPPEMNV